MGLFIFSISTLYNQLPTDQDVTLLHSDWYPIALSLAKTPNSFGQSECNRISQTYMFCKKDFCTAHIYIFEF